MNLHENKTLFRDAILAAAQQLNIPEIYVEKDYWVTLALKRIFSSDVAQDAVFKGGTALSKCHRLINRFSEDIDIVVLKEDGGSASQLAGKLKAVYNAIIPELPEIDIPGITNKKGMIRKTAHVFPKAGFNGSYGQVREHIILESTWLGRPEPYENKTVTSYIGEMMERNNQQQLQEQFAMQPFLVQVLSIKRTVCEKLMSLVRFSFTETPYIDLANKIRHVYDLTLLLTADEIAAFFYSEEFDEMLNMVGADDVLSFKNNNEWLANHPSTAIIFADPENTWLNIRQAYNGSFGDLIIGKLPSEEDVVARIKQVSERIQQVEWHVNPAGNHGIS